MYQQHIKKFQNYLYIGVMIFSSKVFPTENSKIRSLGFWVHSVIKRVRFEIMAINISPWSVKGVEPEAREAAKIAARRAGLTIGSWLNQIIRAAATEQLTSLPYKTNISDQSHNNDNSSAQKFENSPNYSYEQQYNPAQQFTANQEFNHEAAINDLKNFDIKIKTNIEKRGPEDKLHMDLKNEYYSQLGATIQALFDSMESLDVRVKQTELKTTALVEPLTEQLGRLSKQLTEIKVKERVSFAPMELTLMRINERLDKIENS